MARATSCADVERFQPAHVWRPLVLFSLITFACLTAVFWIDRITGGRMAFDEVKFHLPAIRHFMQGGTISDYSSATTPGYHLMMALIASTFNDEIVPMRIAGAAITGMLVFCISTSWTRFAGPRTAWLALPAGVSIYILPGGIWLLPDNLAWLTVWASLALCLLNAWRWEHVAAMSLACLCAIWVRQSNAWVLAPALIALWVGPGRDLTVARRAAYAAIIAAPTIALLGYFTIAWGGLVPPSFQQVHQKPSLIAPAWLLVQIFLGTIFYAPTLIRLGDIKSRLSSLGPTIAKGAAVGLALSLIAPSNFSTESGRWSGLWQVSKLFPCIFDRSIFVVFASTVGAAFLTLILSQAPAPRRIVLLSSIVGFGLASASNHYVFNKYFFGFVAILTPFLAPNPHTPTTAKTLLFPTVFFCLNLAILVTKII